MSDMVNRPPHYLAHPYRCECGKGIECIDVIEHLPHLEACAVKYLWRAGLKGDRLEDLRKARWYVDRAIQLEELRRASVTASLTGGRDGQR